MRCHGHKMWHLVISVDGFQFKKGLNVPPTCNLLPLWLLYIIQHGCLNHLLTFIGPGPPSQDNPSSGFATSYDLKQPAQLQRQAKLMCVAS